MSRHRSGQPRRFAALALALLALALAGAGTSFATDPVLGGCQTGATPADSAAAITATPEDAGVAGPAGPLADPACEPESLTTAEIPVSDDPGPQAPEPLVVEHQPPASEAPQTLTTSAAAETAVVPSPTAHPSGDESAGAPAASDRVNPEAQATPSRPAVTQHDAEPAPLSHALTHRRPSRTISPTSHPHRRHHIAEQADVYFPPVFVDWAALTPFAPPEFGAGEATRFPGPLFLLPIYQAAAAQYNVPWQVLASINEIETNFGANTSHSSAGAVGWMQFLPGTWRTYGVDANGDGIANPEDPVDAIFGAARYLHASGSVRDLGRALFSYNHANWYVARVLQRAAEIGSIPQDLLTSLTEAGRRDAGALRRATGSEGYLERSAEPDTIGRVMLLGDAELATAILADDRVQIYACGRNDVRAGVIDRRVLETIEYLASVGLQPSVSSLRCGHGFHAASGNISEHSYGDAADISRVNGIPILGHQGAGSITDSAIQQLLKLGGALRPHQIISLMTFAGASNTLALGDHDDHIHIGFAPVRPLEGS